ncbi:MAG: L-asparaginase [Rhodobacteraceae bacterium]|nr:L-asparaginase [Paracoccaceae bacterium]
MTEPHSVAEIWRGSVLECTHRAHVVVAEHGMGAGGHGAGIRQSWGDPTAQILPRSSCKMVQALPLVASGAADTAGLSPRHLALACASHSGADIHIDLVADWLKDLGLDQDHFRCGAHMPRDKAVHDRLIRADQPPGQIHNNCSGKHTGFLTLTQHLKAGPEYIDIDHPVQASVRDAFCELTGADGDTWAVDGCSAPNFACTVEGLARAMAWFATAGTRSDGLSAAAARLTQAMMAHPELVAGEDRACTDLMRAMEGRAAIKTGAEGVFVAILPGKGLGVAVKAVDGATRAAEIAIAAVLVQLGVLNADHPATRKYMSPTITNWRGIDTGFMRPAPGFPA